MLSIIGINIAHFENTNMAVVNILPWELIQYGWIKTSVNNQLIKTWRFFVKSVLFCFQGVSNIEAKEAICIVDKTCSSQGRQASDFVNFGTAYRQTAYISRANEWHPQTNVYPAWCLRCKADVIRFLRKRCPFLFHYKHLGSLVLNAV